MIFDKLADAIVKHSKLIIAIWVVILLCSVPFALKAGDVMSYDVNDMADEDSESIQGLEVIGEYFPSSSLDVSSVPILIYHYDDPNGLAQANDLVNSLNEAVDKDAFWKDRLDTSQGAAFMPMATQGKDDGSGIMMVAVLYATGTDVNISSDTPALREFIHSVENGVFDAGTEKIVSSYLTGTPAIGFDTSDGAMNDLKRIDPFTILLILILVGLFFRSFVTSATPPMTIGFAFVVVLALIFGLGQIFDIFFITEMMLLVSMMGAGCDYCIFIIARYREERRHGKTHEDALHQSIVWAGESIATSGASVIIGFGAMAICSYSMVSTMGICLALGILVALLAALTLIPAFLAVVGDRVFWPTTMKAFEEGGKATKGWYAWFGRRGESYFEKSARFSLKHAKAIVIVAVLATVPAAYMVATSETSYDMMGAMYTGESGEGMELIDEYADAGMLMPDYVVIQYKDPIATVGTITMPGSPMPTPVLQWTETGASMVDGLGGLYSQMSEDPNIADIAGPFVWDSAVADADADTSNLPATDKVNYILSKVPTVQQAYVASVVGEFRSLGMTDEAILYGNMGPVIDYVANVTAGVIGGDFVESGAGNASFVKISISTAESAMSPTSMDSIGTIRGEVESYVAANSGEVAAKWVTGSAVVMYEVSEVISGEFTNIEILVVVLIILLLFVVMKSYTIPFRSVLTILMSICWTLAMTHIVFVDILGGEVMWLVPLILLVICLGLGMDYDILLTTRIKENVKACGMSNDEAIHHAVTHTGSVITICGLIMGGAFGTLMLSSMEMMQEFGFALCFAILIDALVVRTYIVPAVMHLLGDWNWKGPRFMQGKGKEGSDSSE